MKSRHPTQEERKLWLESNKFTDVKKDAQIPEAEEVPTSSERKLDEGAKKPAAPSSRPPAQSSPKGKELTFLPTREALRRLKAHPIAATLDLHGLTKLEAYAKVQHFLARQQAKGARHVLIITGKGRSGEVGVLRSNLPHWLNEPALRMLISTITYARPEKGGTGVLHVLLKAR